MSQTQHVLPLRRLTRFCHATQLKVQKAALEIRLSILAQIKVKKDRCTHKIHILVETATSFSQTRNQQNRQASNQVSYPRTHHKRQLNRIRNKILK